MLNIDKIKVAIEDLTRTVIMILGDGDYNAAQELLKEKGTFGLILPNTWLLINNAASFREYLLQYKIFL